MDCPNCQTPWKCNGPHLLKGSEYHYQSIDGYYIKEKDYWEDYYKKYPERKVEIVNPDLKIDKDYWGGPRIE